MFISASVPYSSSFSSFNAFFLKDGKAWRAQGVWHFGANKNGLLWSGFQIGKWGDVGEKRLEVMESHFNLASEFELVLRTSRSH